MVFFIFISPILRFDDRAEYFSTRGRYTKKAQYREEYWDRYPCVIEANRIEVQLTSTMTLLVL